MEIDEKYMRRALQLAACGEGFTLPNPMVGAVIVAPDGRIIGEGWHRRCGQGHAEVNAVASVCDADMPLLRESTIYVTLEPCSHYGKTPPCAKLLVDCGIPRVVVGAGDPNPKVNGRGIAMLREAGTEVVTGVLAEESKQLNSVFFHAQTKRMPFIMLKWAQSADGFMDSTSHAATGKAFAFSTPLTRLSTMRLRADVEAILTTAATVNADNPQLTLQDWEGRAPRRFVVERRKKANSGSRIFDKSAGNPAVTLSADAIETPFRILYDEYGVTSVLVEAGPAYLSALMEAGLWDRLRVEISPVVLGADGIKKAPALPSWAPASEIFVEGNRLLYFDLHK